MTQSLSQKAIQNSNSPERKNLTRTVSTVSFVNAPVVRDENASKHSVNQIPVKLMYGNYLSVEKSERETTSWLTRDSKGNMVPVVDEDW